MNPLFKQYGGNQPSGNILQQFGQFMQQMKGKNPSEMINRLVSEGKVSQEQLNQAQAQAQQMQGIFKPFFGLK